MRFRRRVFYTTGRHGESGVVAVGAVITSAIDEAIGQSDAIEQLPVTPQRIQDLPGRQNATIVAKTSMDALA